MQYLANFLCATICLMLCLNYNVYAMGKRIITYDNVYEENGRIFAIDEVYYDGWRWWRRDIDLTDFTSLSGYPPYTYYADELIIHDTPAPVELPIVYKRPDLIFYVDAIDPLTNSIHLGRFSRRKSKNIEVYYKSINKPYVRLGKFTVSGVKPLNGKEIKWQDVEELICTTAIGKFSADAVIVEGWEEVKFKQEDYWPITKFQYPTYIRFNCVAVAFKETAEIPEYLKIIEIYECDELGYKPIGDFLIELDSEYSWRLYAKKVRKKAYDLYKPDGFFLKKEETISKGNIFFKGKKRYTFTAVNFDEQTKQKYFIQPFKKKFGIK